MSYKGLLTSPQLADYYADLSNPAYETGIATFHRRYSTNTFPNWTLAQPFRLMCHNGEINTIRTTRNAVSAFVRGLKPPLPGGDLLTPRMSDSARLDEWVEYLDPGTELEPVARAAALDSARLGHGGRRLGSGRLSTSSPIAGERSAVSQRGTARPGSSAPMAAHWSALVDRMGLRPVRWCSDKRGWLYIGSRVRRLRPRHDQPSSPAASFNRAR